MDFLPFALLVLLAIPQILSTARVVKHLRRCHPEAWESLGRPNPYTIGDIATTARFWRFIFSDSSATLSDQALNRSARFLKNMSAAYLATFLLIVLVFAVSIVG